MKKPLIFTGIVLSSLSARAQEFPKVIVPGDYPDPSIMRDGKDYYMTHSPFYYAPGFLIWHSTDLLNWEPISRVITEYKGSAMAPDLLKYNGKYYLYYPAAGTNWVVWAENIKGPWSKPIDLKVSGIDPGHVVGEDGKRYLFLSEGNNDMPMIRLSDDGFLWWERPGKFIQDGSFPSTGKPRASGLNPPN